MKLKFQLIVCYFILISGAINGQINFSKHIIDDTTGTSIQPYSVYASDIDGDGDMDMLSASSSDNKIAWYENEDGLGSFGIQKVISTNCSGATAVFTIDIDGDGDVDVLSSSKSDNKIAWYENLDGLGNFGGQQIISTNCEGALSIFATDLDGDGDVDVLSASIDDNKIAWYENLDGLGDFGDQIIISDSCEKAYSVFAGDIDGDGDMDVLSASFGDIKIVWYENKDGLGDFGDEKIISSTCDGAKSVHAVDINNDGFIDVLAASSKGDKIVWFKNDDGIGNFSEERIVSSTAGGANSIYASDIDHDGDMDVLAASRDDDKVEWYENTDGMGNFETEHIITSNFERPYSVFAEDINGDGYVDVLSTSFISSKVAWFKNSDGLGNFEDEQILSSFSNGPHTVFSSDIDGDGDIDVLIASTEDNKISWYENTDGLGSF